ncbi:FAD-dependent oxidoreductase [Devosia sp. A369]
MTNTVPPADAGQWDTIVVGAGPAGLAAATLLAEHKLRVLLLDEQPAPGGQIYRGIERTPAGSRKAETLGSDYLHGADLVRRFRASAAAYWPETNMWHVAPGLEVFASREGITHKLQTSKLILATGAMERPVPVAGWTLPGVMTAGALQILIKNSALVADEPIVIAGSGPLFYLLAHQCVLAGVPIAALLDTAESGHMLGAIRAMPRALTGKGPGYLLKGLKLKLALRRAGIPTYGAVRDIEIQGNQRAEGVRFRSGNKTHHIVAGLVALHEGVIPGQNATRMLGCAHVWDQRQFAFKPVLDAGGASSVEGIRVAGDAGGIVGARSAEHQGRLAALDILHELGRLDNAARDRLAADERRALNAHLSVRAFLDDLYPPRTAINTPSGDVVLCRCESVSASAVHALAKDGLGPNQIKAALRCGMGPCQGRLCGSTVAQVVAAAQGQPPQDYYNIRPPLKPVSMGEIATLAAKRP